MPKEYLTHKFCDHGEGTYDRKRCRGNKRHAECDHEQTPRAQRACEAAQNEAEES